MRIEHILELKEEIPITKEAVRSFLLLHNFAPAPSKTNKHTVMKNTHLKTES